ncbi:MAG: hypothetical protein FIB01_15285 [Gemmatimonadetes bacterium]|nr:hypothetical protein [Gemmatimonadota bacterium]
MSKPQRPGTTLLELLCGLTLLGLILGMAAVPFAHTGDVLAVRAGRDAILNAAAAARTLAATHGGATLSISASDGTISLATRDSLVTDTLARLGPELRIRVAFDDARLQVALIRFDALGLGRLANRTIRLRRGAVQGGVTFSAYGRARPW